MRLKRNSVLFKYGKYALLVYCVIVLVLNAIPFGAPTQVGVSDKILHFFAFFVYGFLFATTSEDFVLSLGFPIFAEIFQLFVPWRFFEVIDMGINLIATVLGFYMLRFFKEEPSFP